MTKNNPPNDRGNNPSNKTNEFNLPRRNFLLAASAVAGGGLFGVGATGGTTANKFSAEFANRRVREVMNAWNKGFRGQPDRTLGVLADGLEARHPDIGPWNGIRAVPDGENGLTLTHENLKRLEVADDLRVFAESRSIPPNAGDIRHEYPFSGPEDVHRVEAHLQARPYGSAKELRLLLETVDGDVIDKQAGLHDHTGVAGRIDPGREYVLAVETTADGNVSTSYSLESQYFTDSPDGETDPFADVDSANVTADTPKVVGWYNEEARFVSEPNAKPRTGHEGGHGTFLASVMAGSGRASAIDETTVTKDEPQKVLLGDEHLVYEVEADPGTGVFGAAFGERIQVEIFGPNGNFLAHNHDRNSAINRTHIIEETLTVHETGTKTYEVHVHPKRQTHTFSATSEAPARVERVCVGAFKKPNTTVGDRSDGDQTLHAGIAPNAGLVGLSGYLQTRRNLQDLADDFARLFNLRALVIKLGYDKSLGIAGGTLSEGSVKAMKALAEAGILPVSRTENIQAGSQADKAPGIADEAVTVVEAGPWDGIYALQKNEPAAIDEDEAGVYRKPDVTAPALDFPLYESIKGAKGGDAFRPEHEQSPIRDYGYWLGPYLDGANVPFVAGTAGLVAQALEEEAPAGIALPSPKKAGFVDTMRLKQTILATASETPFTAAPWHNREPTYNFGGHDPIEGWGRVNIDAAVEAAARDLTPPSARAEESQQGRPPMKTNIKESVGLKLPDDSRAVAGHIAGEPGVYEVAIDYSHCAGEDQALVDGPPHLDLFVYAAEKPAKHGTPNIVSKAQGLTGSASLQFTAGHSTASATEGGTYYVVAKLVNVPGVFNSFDIQAPFDLTVKSL